MIPLNDPLASYLSRRSDIDQAIRLVLESGWYALGKEVESFENEFADFHGEECKAVGLGNGTDAIALALLSLGLGEGDEVITVSHTAVATVAAIEQAGCVPVFADIDPLTRCICPQSIEARASESTKAIVPVHIYGQPCSMKAVMEVAHRLALPVVEDCSQAHAAQTDGRKVGTFGVLGTFSFYPTKNLGAIGDGGMILCKDAEKADHLKRLRQYGWDESRQSLHQGVNSRLDELQAAVLRVKLRHLEEDNRKRRQAADLYDDSLNGLPLVRPLRKENELHAMHLYVIECENRDGLATHLREKNVQTGLHYPLPVHMHPAYAGRIRGEDDLPNTEAFYQRNLSLPLFPEIPRESIGKIASEIISWFELH